MKATPIRRNWRGPPVGYVFDTKRYLTVSESVRFVGAELITSASMSRYAQAGEHPCGLDLGVVTCPLERSSRHKPRSERNKRFLIPEDKLAILRELLQDHRRHRTGAIRAEDFALMQDRARWANSLTA